MLTTLKPNNKKQLAIVQKFFKDKEQTMDMTQEMERNILKRYLKSIGKAWACNIDTSACKGCMFNRYPSRENQQSNKCRILDIKLNNPEKYKQLLIKWAKAHPVKTNLDVLKECGNSVDVLRMLGKRAFIGFMRKEFYDWLNSPAKEI